METLTLALFCLLLCACLLARLPILYALSAGLALFLVYGRRRGFAWKSLAKMSLSGIKAAKNILLTFGLIGMLTALWRASGTIAVIICYSAGLFRPGTFLLMTFLLNCAVSFLTGTSFGTSATVGVICMTMASTLGMEPLWVGGAILSGAFFGDRCSPVSTSVLLVSDLTHTSIFQNIRNAFRTGLAPFLLSCGIYWLAGMNSAAAGAAPNVWQLFDAGFTLHWLCLLPAVAVLALSLGRVNVRWTMSVSIGLAVLVCLLVQKLRPQAILTLMLVGYRCPQAQLAPMLDGGGISSMLRVAAIVCLSSCYAGIFQGTGMLGGLQEKIAGLGQRMTPYGATLFTSLFTAAIACNQTLCIMLTHQLCATLEPEPAQTALDLEDSSVILAPLIPWSIAGAVPLATVGAPAASLLTACFLYLLPLCRLLGTLMHSKKTGQRPWARPI